MKTALIVIIALLIVGGAIYAYRTNDAGYGLNTNGDGEAVVCTMDAKLCPDGSYVGRTGPRCEFAPCPGKSTTTGMTGIVVTSTTTSTTTTTTSTSTR